MVIFAPLSIPISRRLQTLAVLVSTIFFVLGPFIGTLLFIYFMFSRLYLIAAIYGAFLFLFDYDIPLRGGRRCNVWRKLSIWKYYCDYFPIKLHKTAELDTKKNYLFGYHPHGIISCGAFGSFGTEGNGFSKIFPGITPHLMTLKLNFRWPFMREYLLALGIVDVSKESLNYIFTKKGTGNAGIIVIGGAAESLEATPKAATIILKGRKGFVKVAIRNGAQIVPVYGFGENDLINTARSPRLRKIQEFIRKWSGIAPVVVYGRGIFQYSFGFMPYRVPVNLVVGAPIEVIQSDDPSQEEIDRLHSKYVEELTKLYNDHRELYSRTPDVELTII